MDNILDSYPNILYSCAYQKEQSSEQFIPEHSLGMILSGESQYFTNEGILVMGEGKIGFARRNQLVKKVKKPAPNGDPFKTITIILDQNSLHQYAAENNIPRQSAYKGKAMIDLTGNVFLKGFFDSLLPYINNPKKLTPAIATLKTLEAIELLLQMDDFFQNLLFDFQEPHKIDLEAFMNQNYKYNVSLQNFAKLTGRSLSTFKRDFAKIFNASPEKWLQHKRLEQAHYLILKGKQRPTDVYLEVGFENLSHFSFAFKKHYGLSPTELTQPRKNISR
jgi:AraC-like DNA-binding protein